MAQSCAPSVLTFVLTLSTISPEYAESSYHSRPPNLKMDKGLNGHFLKEMQIAAKHVRRCLIPFIIRKMQIRTTVIPLLYQPSVYNCKQNKTEKLVRMWRNRNSSYIADRNVKKCSHLGK